MGQLMAHIPHSMQAFVSTVTLSLRFWPIQASNAPNGQKLRQKQRRVNSSRTRMATSNSPSSAKVRKKTNIMISRPISPGGERNTNRGAPIIIEASNSASRVNQSTFLATTSLLCNDYFCKMSFLARSNNSRKKVTGQIQEQKTLPNRKARVKGSTIPMIDGI